MGFTHFLPYASTHPSIGCLMRPVYLITAIAVIEIQHGFALRQFFYHVTSQATSPAMAQARVINSVKIPASQVQELP
jgi:hypothetical protein